MKSMKVKVLCAAVAMAGSTVAFGAIDTGVTSGNGELFLSVYDTRDAGAGGQRSYTRDLGTVMNDWVSNTGVINAAKVDVGFTQSFGTDANWATFISGMSTTDVAGLRWDVYALDVTGNGTNGRRFLTTTNADLSINTNRPTLSGINGGMSSVSNHLVASNFKLPDNLNFAQNLSVIAGPADGTANALNGKQQNLLGGVPFNTAANIGETLNFFYLTANGTSPLARANYDQFDNLVGAATFQLAANGDLTYVAAVPEAETWAMFVAGLLGVGAMARRRLAA